MLKFLARIFGTKGPSTRELLGEGAIVVDVRSPREYQGGHVKGSRNIPLQSISAKAASLKKQKKVIITCCASGMRSGKAAKLLRQLGVEAHNGGAWHSVERARQGK